MRLIIEPDYDTASRWTEYYKAKKNNRHTSPKPFVLVLPTGSSLLGIDKELNQSNKSG
jgi:glucosamine-6-phosphate deaminase